MRSKTSEKGKRLIPKKKKKRKANLALQYIVQEAHHEWKLRPKLMHFGPELLTDQVYHHADPECNTERIRDRRIIDRIKKSRPYVISIFHQKIICINEVLWSFC